MSWSSIYDKNCGKKVWFVSLQTLRLDAWYTSYVQYRYCNIITAQYLYLNLLHLYPIKCHSCPAICYRQPAESVAMSVINQKVLHMKLMCTFGCTVRNVALHSVAATTIMLLAWLSLPPTTSLQELFHEPMSSCSVVVFRENIYTSQSFRPSSVTEGSIVCSTRTTNHFIGQLLGIWQTTLGSVLTCILLVVVSQIIPNSCICFS